MVDDEATRRSGPDQVPGRRSFFLPRSRGEYRCRYCLEEFRTEADAVDYCMYAPHGRHEDEPRSARQPIGYPWKGRCPESDREGPRQTE